MIIDARGASITYGQLVGVVCSSSSSSLLSVTLFFPKCGDRGIQDGGLSVVTAESKMADGGSRMQIKNVKSR